MNVGGAGLEAPWDALAGSQCYGMPGEEEIMSGEEGGDYISGDVG